MTEHRFIAETEPSTDCEMVECLVKLQNPNEGIKRVKEVITNDEDGTVTILFEKHGGSEGRKQLFIDVVEDGPLQQYEVTYRGEHTVVHRVFARTEEEAHRRLAADRGWRVRRSDFDEYEVEMVEIVKPE